MVHGCQLRCQRAAHRTCTQENICMHKHFIDIWTESYVIELILQMVVFHKPLQELLLWPQSMLRSIEQYRLRILLQYALYQIPECIIRIKCLIEIPTREQNHAILRQFRKSPKRIPILYRIERHIELLLRLDTTSFTRHCHSERTELQTIVNHRTAYPETLVIQITAVRGYLFGQTCNYRQKLRTRTNMSNDFRWFKVNNLFIHLYAPFIYRF